MMEYTCFSICKETWRKLEPAPLNAARDGSSLAPATVVVVKKEHTTDDHRCRITYEIGHEKDGPGYPFVLIEEWILDGRTGYPKRSKS